MKNTSEITGAGKGSEIPRRDWEAFFQQFSQDHQEWLVAIAEHGKEITTSHEVNGRPFEALTFHLDHDDEVLSVVVRQDAKKDTVTQGHVYLSVPRPRRVMIERSELDTRLHIDAADGSLMTIRFRRVVTPDYETESISGISENIGQL